MQRSHWAVAWAERSRLPTGCRQKDRPPVLPPVDNTSPGPSGQPTASGHPTASGGTDAPVRRRITAEQAHPLPLRQGRLQAGGGVLRMLRVAQNGDSGGHGIPSAHGPRPAQARRRTTGLKGSSQVRSRGRQVWGPAVAGEPAEQASAPRCRFQTPCSASALDVLAADPEARVSDHPPARGAAPANPASAHEARGSGPGIHPTPRGPSPLTATIPQDRRPPVVAPANPNADRPDGIGPAIGSGPIPAAVGIQTQPGLVGKTLEEQAQQPPLQSRLGSCHFPLQRERRHPARLRPQASPCCASRASSAAGMAWPAGSSWADGGGGHQR